MTARAEQYRLLEEKLSSLAAAESWLRIVTSQRNFALEETADFLRENIGQVLPLKGIAHMATFSNGRGLITVPTRSLLSNNPPIIAPSYYRIGNVGDEIVMLAHPEEEDPRVGFATLIGSLAIATSEDIRVTALLLTPQVEGRER